MTLNHRNRYSGAKKVTEVTAGLLLRAAMYDDFPITVQPMIDNLERFTIELQKLENDLLPEQYNATVAAKNMYVLMKFIVGLPTPCRQHAN